jgi:hypothetical protein
VRPPTGNPTKDTIQRATVRAFDGRRVLGGAVLSWDMDFSFWSVPGRGLAGDPRRQQVVGVVREVVADQDVEQVGVALQVGLGQDHELALAGADGQLDGAGEVAGVAGEHRRGHEDGRRVRRRSQGEDLGRGTRVTADEAVEEDGLIGGHNTTVDRSADGALTAGLTIPVTTPVTAPRNGPRLGRC